MIDVNNTDQHYGWCPCASRGLVGCRWLFGQECSPLWFPGGQQLPWQPSSLPSSWSPATAETGSTWNLCGSTVCLTTSCGLPLSRCVATACFAPLHGTVCTSSVDMFSFGACLLLCFAVSVIHHCQPADRATFVACTLLCCSVKNHTCHWQYALLCNCAVFIVTEHIAKALEPFCDMPFSCRRWSMFTLPVPVVTCVTCPYMKSPVVTWGYLCYLSLHEVTCSHMRLPVLICYLCYLSLHEVTCAHLCVQWCRVAGVLWVPPLESPSPSRPPWREATCWWRMVWETCGCLVSAFWACLPLSALGCTR